MRSLQAFRRPDGTVGIRNHLFILPAVVCANQVAIDVARRQPKLKYIEHQHGCAQIGADLTQTQRVFSQLALHPNVYASMFVGLGCEGIVAKDLFSSTHRRSMKPMELVVIQESGGTLGAESIVERWVAARDIEMNAQTKKNTDWNEIAIGLLLDDSPQTTPERIAACLEAFYQLGARIIVPSSHKEYLKRFEPHLPVMDYGATTPEHSFAMHGGSNVLETATGLAAAGAHLIVHLAAQPHGFGIPLVPLVRWSVNEQSYTQFHDDFDGKLNDDLDVPRLIEQLSRIVNGQPSVAEELGMDDFALYRIGPTV
ncbi:MAG: UxaA family hydrolase [Bacilli bacterium]